MECAKAQAEAQEELQASTTAAHRPAPGAASGTRQRVAGKLKDKRAVITGGDAGIGRAVALLFAREGAKVIIVHLPGEQEDAEKTKLEVEHEGSEVLLVASDLSRPANCKDVVERIAQALGGIDILVNNVATKQEQQSILDISEQQWTSTMQVNLDSYFYFTKYALPYMAPGSSIINSASVDAYIGVPTRLDYATSKGAVVAFTRALSNQLVKTKGIRVNSVAAGPVDGGGVTESVTAAEHPHGLGNWTPMQRVGKATEVATSYVFLASQEGAFFSGQTLHPNGGIVVHG